MRPHGRRLPGVDTNERIPKVVLVVGPCGAGKTSALARMRALLVGRVGEVAVLETDTIYTMIDPTWSAYNARRAAMCAHVTAATAAQFVEEGCDWVVVGSNGLQDREGVAEFVGRLPDYADVLHLFLDPSTAAVQARIEARAHPLDIDKTPEWLAGNVAWMRSYHRPESGRIDNTDLTVDQTVEAIFEAVNSGTGLIRGRDDRSLLKDRDGVDQRSGPGRQSQRSDDAEK
jgi:hypothetical protein